jgi:hypothetical protein
MPQMADMQRIFGACMPLSAYRVDVLAELISCEIMAEIATNRC